MTAINPYLIFNGKAEEAFNFYKSVFGGKFAGIQRFKDMPSSKDVPKGEEDLIMHVALPIGKGNMLMGSDAPESSGKVIVGSNSYISVNVDSKAEAKKLFNGLSAGGEIQMPLADMFWGAYFGMLKDKFGVQWMVSHDNKTQK
ncbi:VOC family protein [Candidatus Woesearchaeota archaeon]|nr:VOC family protein [Candidatus Woesearchaeota archaeon]